MTVSSLNRALHQLVHIAEIRGNAAETAGWRRLAADADRWAPGDLARLTELARRGHSLDIPNLPSPIHAQFREVLTLGADASIEAALASVPAVFRRLLASGVVDSAEAVALARDGIVSFSDFRAALQDGRLAHHLKNGSRLALVEGTLRNDRTRVTLGRAVEMIEGLVPMIEAAHSTIAAITPAGDVRRVEPIVETVAIVGHAPDPSAAIEAISALPVLRVLHRTSRRIIAAYQQVDIDIRIVAPDEFGTALHAATGSEAHVAAVKNRHGAPRLLAREEDVYANAGLPWIAPELRQGSGEIEAAAAGSLPVLVGRGDIRGDLHMHTTYSDGRDILADMVQAAAALGYDYIAITDHSPRAAASRTLTRETLARQRDELERLRPRFPRLTILHGAEVDIMPDGSLDFPDDVLESLDIVLASLHDGRGHDPARLTRRCLAAIAHPLVNVITHPANRLVGHSPGYQLDFGAIYQAAAGSGTALEIDGAPSHLDLDGEHAREAVQAGVTFTIDGDCHKAALLDRQMTLGLGTARRGWVGPGHVLNTRSIDEVRAFITAKRQARR